MTYKRTILITGSTDGIGKQTASDLYQNPENHIVIHGRNEKRCLDAISSIQSTSSEKGKHGKLSSVTADFSDVNEVVKLAETLEGNYPELNIVICNAGVLLPKREVSKQGLELAFQVNHLSHFILVNKLLPLLKKNIPSRIINVSSICHNWYPMDWEDIQAEAGYEKYAQYSRTKLMNHLFTFELASKLKNTQVTCNVLEPGVVETKLLKAGGYSGSPVEKSGRVGKYLAESSDVQNTSGEYYSNSCRRISSGEEALIKKDQEKLWQLSLELCKKFEVNF